jgi:hypothetical protein
MGGPSKFLAHRHSACLHSKGARGSKAEYSRSFGTLTPSSFRVILLTYNILKEEAFQGASPAF